MKKFFSVLLSFVLLASSFWMLTASAWETPRLLLSADYDAQKKTVTVLYRILDFAGTESADFRLQYDPAVLKMTDYEETQMRSVLMQTYDHNGLVAIQFVDMYYVRETDCDADGGKTIVSFTFELLDSSAENAAFTAWTDSYAMDPDTIKMELDSVTLTVPLSEGSGTYRTQEVSALESDVSEEETQAAENEDAGEAQDSGNLKKAFLAAAAAAVIFIALLAVIVWHYRKQGEAKE